MTSNAQAFSGLSLVKQPIHTSVCLTCKVRKPDSQIDAETQVCHDCTNAPKPKRQRKPKAEAAPVKVTKMPLRYQDIGGGRHLIYRQPVGDAEPIYLGWCWQVRGHWHVAHGKGGWAVWQGGPYSTRAKAAEALEAWLADQPG